MKRDIWQAKVSLKSLSGLPIPETLVTRQYGNDLLEQARKNLEAKNLAFNNKTGAITLNGVCIERFSNRSDFAPHRTVEDIMRWEFSRHIANEAWHIKTESKANALVDHLRLSTWGEYKLRKRIDD